MYGLQLLTEKLECGNAATYGAGERGGGVNVQSYYFAQLFASLLHFNPFSVRFKKLAVTVDKALL